MFHLQNESARTKVILMLIIGIFIAAGIFSVCHYGNSLLLGSLEKFNNDDVKYIRSAWTLLDTGTLTYQSTSQPTVYIMPGLTGVLAFFMLLFGKLSGIVAFRIFQVLLQALSIYLLFLIARRLFNSALGILACILDLFYTTEFYAANLVLTESIFKFLVLLLFYISLQAIEKKRLSLYLWGGVVWVAAIYFRPTIGAFPLLILILWLKEKYSWQDMVKYGSAVLLIFVVLMSPWWIRNYAAFDQFIPLTLSSGNPFLQGTYINYDQSSGRVSYELSTNEIQQDANEKRTGWERLATYVPKEPFAYIYWYTLGKSIFFWIVPFYWKEILGVPFIFVYPYHFLILCFAAYGFHKYRKQRKKSQPPAENTKLPAVNTVGRTLSLLTILYFNLVYLPYYTFSRYSFPVMPLVMIWAAYGLTLKFPRWAQGIKAHLQK